MSSGTRDATSSEGLVHQHGGGPAPAAPPRQRWRIQRRGEVDNVQLYRVGTVVVGVALLTLIWAFNVQQTPGQFLSVLWTGTLGSSLGIQNIINAALPLIFLGLAVAIPFRLGLWNLGAEGQLLMGAWAATALAFSMPGAAAPILIAGMAVAGIVAGAIWMLVPALARAYLGISEIITTLLLNFVALFWLAYWATGQWTESSTTGGVKSRLIPEQTRLGEVAVGDINLPIGILVAVGIAIAIGLWLHHSRFGFEARIVGANRTAGRYAGISVTRKILVMMLLGGAIAGLAGAFQLMDVTHRYSSSLAENAGYTAIVVAVLAAGSASGVIVLAFLLGVISAGIDSLLVYGVPSDALFAVFGLILLLGAVGDAFARFRVIRIQTSAASRSTDAPAVGVADFAVSKPDLRTSADER